MIRNTHIPTFRGLYLPTHRGRLRGVDTTSLGCLSWPACVSGGTLCADPQSFGASLNPCCHFAPPPGPCPDNTPPTPNSDGSYGLTGAAADAAATAIQNVLTPAPATTNTLLIVALAAGGLFLWSQKR